MLRISMAFVIILITGTGLPVFVPAAGAGLFENVSEARLDNGLKVILLENRMAPVITFQVWYHAGSRKDPWGRTGLAHVFEHMMFKGTGNYPGEEFARLIQSQGGNFNAFTSHDFAGYFENMPSDRIDIAMELEADRMQSLVLNEEEFEKEVNVVKEERRMRVEDDPRALLAEQARATAFQAQPYHWPIIGWMNDLNRLTLDDVRRHYKSYYIPANAFVVVVGDFQTSEMTDRIRKWFGPISSGDQPPVIGYQDPPQQGERRVNVYANAEMPSVVMGYHVPNLENRDAYVLEVIAALLSAGRSSILYRELVLEKELAVSVNARNPLLSMDPDLFYVTAEPHQGVSPERMEKAIDSIIERLRTETVSERQLETAKNKLETSFIYNQDSVFYQGMLLAMYEIATGWEDVRKYVSSVREVTPEDIKRVAGKYLKKERRTVGIMYPKKGNDDRASGQDPGDGE